MSVQTFCPAGEGGMGKHVQVRMNVPHIVGLFVYLDKILDGRSNFKERLMFITVHMDFLPLDICLYRTYRLLWLQFPILTPTLKHGG